MSYKESEVESELQGERGGERVTRRARWRASELQGERMELEEYVSVRFAGNGSKRWDEKEIEVPSKTVVRLGRWTAEGLEEAEVHWPVKGKSKGKIWKCVMLPGDSEIPVPPAKRPATEDIISDITTKPSTRGKWRLERDLAELERERAARELTTASTNQADVDSSKPSTTANKPSTTAKSSKSKRAAGKYCIYIYIYLR